MVVMCGWMLFRVCFFKLKSAYEMRISDWSSDVCSSDLPRPARPGGHRGAHRPGRDVTQIAHRIGVAGADEQRPVIGAAGAPVEREGDLGGGAIPGGACHQRLIRSVLPPRCTL